MTQQQQRQQQGRQHVTWSAFAEVAVLSTQVVRERPQRYTFCGACWGAGCCAGCRVSVEVAAADIPYDVLTTILKLEPPQPAKQRPT
jgi:hypothetical protein